MNVLFLCHNGFASNSMNHITGFARGLRARGHASAVAVPDDSSASLEALWENPPFKPVLFSETWREAEALFPDRQPADVIHAWTPREHVRRAVARCRDAMPAADLVIHLEDNEDYLSAASLQTDRAGLRQLTDEELSARLLGNLAHPFGFHQFLRSADGITGIIASLADFVAAGVPFREIWPGIDFDAYHPGPPDVTLRESLGIQPQEKILCYTGNTHFGNQAEVQSLYEAVFQLNRRGVACRLVRTGVDDPGFMARFSSAELDRHVIPLGFVAPERLPALLRLADVLVQPGERNEFNHYRLPSKLPEFLATGRPVLMPEVNIGLRIRSGEEALLLETGSPEEIANRCEEVFHDPALAARLSAGAATFARRHFDGTANSRALAYFYAEACSLWRRPAPGRASRRGEASTRR